MGATATGPRTVRFDFASPNAYLAYRALPPILERTGESPIPMKPREEKMR